MIRHPEGKLAGQSSDFFASTHDIPRTLLSFMGVRALGLMNGEDLSVVFDGQQAPERRWFTACYDNYLLAGDRDWFLLSDSEGRRKRLYNRREDPEDLTDVADQHPESSPGSGGCSRMRPAAPCRNSAHPAQGRYSAADPSPISPTGGFPRRWLPVMHGRGAARGRTQAGELIPRSRWRLSLLRSRWTARAPPAAQAVLTGTHIRRHRGR